MPKNQWPTGNYGKLSCPAFFFSNSFDSEGMPVGVKVTLKGEEMYQFMDKLVEIVLPRLKEWPGLSITAGDGNGNVALGFPPSALALFPEIEGSFDVYPKMTGFDVTFNTTAYTNTDGRLLLSAFSVPFNVKK
jgi:large subunit ribosomal protein L5